MTLKDKRIEWKKHYSAWSESGQNIAEWCRDHNIKAHQMYYWVQQFERELVPRENTPTQTKWLSVQVGDSEKVASTDRNGPAFIHFEGISVEIRTDTHIRLLSEIVQVLKNQC